MADPKAPANGTAMPLAIAAIVVLGLILPAWLWLSGVFQTISFFGSSVDDDARARGTTSFVIGLVCAGISVVVVLVASRRSSPVPRAVVGTIAVLVALITGGVNAATAIGIQPERQTQAEEETGPTCGPDSHPTVFGGDARYDPCPEQIAEAELFLEKEVPRLPVSEVTLESVRSSAPDAEVGMVDESSIGVAWLAAPVTCATATWDGTAWTTEVVGLYVDGGCARFLPQ